MTRVGLVYVDDDGLIDLTVYKVDCSTLSVYAGIRQDSNTIGSTYQYSNIFEFVQPNRTIRLIHYRKLLCRSTSVSSTLSLVGKLIDNTRNSSLKA